MVGKTIESFREAFGRALVEIGKENENVVVLDADVKSSTKTIYFEKTFPDRFFQLGISEQDLVSTAAGFAIAGRVPVVSAFAAFMMRAWEQIRNTIARDNLNVKIVTTHSGFSDFMDGSSHQCLEDIALMRTLPNMGVIVPADAYATRTLLRQIIENEGPFYMRLGRDHAVGVYDDEELEIGKAEILREGEDIFLIACGPTVPIALEAAERLRDLSVGVADFHTIKPMDEGTLLKIAKKANLIVTLEEHSIFGGLGGAVAEVLGEKMPKRVIRIGTRDFGRSSRSYLTLLDFYGLSAEKVVKRVAEAVGR